MFGIALGRSDAALILTALEAFDSDYAAPEERRRLSGIMSALRVELSTGATPCLDLLIEDDGRVFECRLPHGHPGVWHSDAADGDGRLWRDA